GRHAVAPLASGLVLITTPISLHRLRARQRFRFSLASTQPNIVDIGASPRRGVRASARSPLASLSPRACPRSGGLSANALSRAPIPPSPRIFRAPGLGPPVRSLLPGGGAGGGPPAGPAGRGGAGAGAGA